MNLPLIRVQSSHLLYGSIDPDVQQRWSERFARPFMSYEETEEYTEQFGEVWSEYEQRVLEGMSGLYGVEFKNPIIDVYIVPWSGSISTPLILNPSRPPRVTVEILIHELLHRLLTDNTSYSTYDREQKGQVRRKWAELFGEHERITLVHIPVHAGLKAILLDVLNEPERLERDIVRCQKNPAYKAAWNYVEDHDYRDINRQVAEIYRSPEDARDRVV